jgi:hypothetical protein
VSVRYLALELYRWLKRLEELEKARTSLRRDGGLAERARLETELLEAKKAVEHYRALLAAQKEEPKI